MTIFGGQKLATNLGAQQVGAHAQWVSTPGDPLAVDALPVDSPLTLRVMDADGTLLLDIGAILDETRRQQLFRYFKPHGQRNQADPPGEGNVLSEPPGAGAPAGMGSAAAPPSPAGRVSIDDDPDRAGLAASEMVLSIGTRLGIRLPMGNGRVAYASRLVAPHGPLLVMPPTLDQARLELKAGETVEVVAVCPRSVYLFVCTVEWVVGKPFQYVVLSPPVRVRKLRERRAIRAAARLAVMYDATDMSKADQVDAVAPPSATQPSATDTAPEIPDAVKDAHVTPRTLSGLGVAMDISTVGMSLATDCPLGVVGERVNVLFYVEAEGVTVAVEAECGIRTIKLRKAPEDERGQWIHGLAFGPLPPTERLVLKSYVLNLRLESDPN
ncbi:flagellar brake domain-containing protein [Robbsia andropogonis]|uniref:flagellar brake domain-containing protein n=1 Tax=Robbsia andropogonis TaxID=28092 RepID=UPI0020A21D93|nr:flagellar brake protein [Robbsia andropogonis]MCP1119476.1 flagellar brake protein [Robbsia andropogonis]MCP1129459.1 flagellar brake protein [Robbsia andropogonis]